MQMIFRFAIFISLGSLPSASWAFPYTLTDVQTANVHEHLPFGLPSTGELLFRQGYVVSHNNWLKIPNWTAYHLTKEHVQGNIPRSNDFRPDLSLKTYQRAELVDYRGSGYDRGHIAPAADMRYSTTAVSESFFLSNMTPQVGEGFNQGIWKDIEEMVRDWAKERGEVWVVAGPAFEDTDRVMSFKLLGPHHVAVPTHFFKIVLSKDAEGTLHVIAFLLPNQKLPTKDLPKFITTIRDIEEKTGLDFLNELNDGLEEELETKKAPNLYFW